jgi:hypothetical protein
MAAEHKTPTALLGPRQAAAALEAMARPIMVARALRAGF